MNELINLNNKILGIWLNDPENVESINQFGKVILYFFEDNWLVYRATGGRIFLTWYIEEGMLVTDQPSHPREDRSFVSITEEGKLKWGNSIYVRSYLSDPFPYKVRIP